MIGCMTFYVAASQKCQLLDILCISGDMKCGTHLSLQARWSKDQWLSWIAVIFSQGLQRVYFFKQISKIGKTPARRNFLSSAEMLGSRFLSSVRGVRAHGLRSFATKPKCVMLNAARLDFDGRMDWSKVTNATEFTSYDISSTEEIVPRAQGMDIVMNKELVWVSWSFPFHSTIGESWFYMIL